MQTRLLTALLIAGAPMLAWGAGDKISVASFRNEPKDLTAITEGTMRFDHNGDKAALIRIETVERGFLFDVGSLGVVAVEEQNAAHPAEIWLYVPGGVKTISIQHPQLGVMRNHNLGQRLKGGKTYLMKLTTDRVNTLVVDYDRNGTLEFDIEPKGATLILNGVRQTVGGEGSLELEMALGQHTYRVEAPMYHPLEGVVNLTRPDSVEHVRLELPYAFGFLNVEANADSEGAEVLLDGESVGTLPIHGYRVASGQHRVTVRKRLYEDWNENIAMTDSASVVLRPVLGDNYGVVNLTTGGRGDGIWLDGRFVGDGFWNGQLEPGTYSVEARRTAHRGVPVEFTLLKGETERIAVPAPEPIYGGIEIETTPSGMTVSIDGVEVGTTPYRASEVLIGEKNVCLTKPGFRTETFSLMVGEGEVAREHRTMTDLARFRLYTSPSSAVVRINGSYKSGYGLELPAGHYRVQAEADGYHDYDRMMYFDGNTRDITLRLSRQYIQPTEFYLSAGYDWPVSSVIASAGLYVSNINIEGAYGYGFRSSEVFRWDEGVYKYSPSTFDVRLGYGLTLGRRVRLTPQIGFRYVSLKEKEGEKTVLVQPDMFSGSKRYSLSGTLKVDIALSSVLQLTLRPTWYHVLHDSPGYVFLGSQSDFIDGCGKGLGASGGLTLFF